MAELSDEELREAALTEALRDIRMLMGAVDYYTSVVSKDTGLVKALGRRYATYQKCCRDGQRAFERCSSTPPLGRIVEVHCTKVRTDRRPANARRQQLFEQVELGDGIINPMFHVGQGLQQEEQTGYEEGDFPVQGRQKGLGSGLYVFVTTGGSSTESRQPSSGSLRERALATKSGEDRQGKRKQKALSDHATSDPAVVHNCLAIGDKWFTAICAQPVTPFLRSALVRFACPSPVPGTPSLANPRGGGAVY